jgi:flagellar hook-associated protein 2
MAPLISFGGIASGLDTASIIAALSTLNQKPIQLLQTKKAEFDGLKKKYQTLEGKMKALGDKAKALSTAGDFLAFSAASSDDKVLKATASGQASAGSFAVKVNSLAKTEFSASNGYADFTTTSVGTGDISFTVGGQTTTISIGSGQDTLEKVRDKINAAGIDVSATIVSEGTGANPYKLVLQGKKTGAENGFTIDTSNFSGTLAITETEAATDAEIEVNGLTIQRASNSITDVVPGVTLNLTSTSATAVNVTVNADHSQIKQRIQEYVDTHTDLVNYINNEIKTVNDKGGAFNGESTVRGIKNRLLSQIADGGYPGGSLKSLAQIGVKLQNDGTLTFDHSKFDTVVKDDLEGVTSLLTKKGKSFDDSSFTLFKSSPNLAAGTYTVAITQAATKAAYTASQTFASGAALAADEKLSFTQDGKSAEIQLTAGDDLAASITKLNAGFKDAGLDLVATDDGGALKVAAKKFGSQPSFTAMSDQAAGAGSSGIGTTLANVSGLDVAGTIDGVTLTGEGQNLKGGTSGAFAGLDVRFSGSTPTTSTLTIGTDGYFVKLKDTTDGFLKAVTGPLAARIDGLGNRTSDMDKRISDLEDRALRSEEVLRARFTALEQIMGRFQAAQGFLATFQFPS